MKYISLFSGVEAASVAWEQLGWEPVAFSEIEPFPCAVLAHRFPEVPNLGDITTIDWREYNGSIDLIVGGSPCQSFSLAGKREGLAGESGLMFEYIRCVREIMPRYFVWENVPGALSSEGGAAFGQLLREMDGLGYCLAWRVLDAQFFGVPQRRRRVFLVGSLGNERAADVLFERESMRWDFKTGRNERARLTADAERSAGGNCGERVDARAYTFIDRCGNNWKNGKGGCGVLMQEDVASTLATAFPQSVMQPITPSAGQANAEIDENVAPTQTCAHEQTIICVADDNAHSAIDTELAGALKVGGGKAFVAYKGAPKYIVRRLTPVECERLQGFPDGWTDVEYRGKPAANAPRYKAMGNSMAVPVMRWIGERLQAVDNGAGR